MTISIFLIRVLVSFLFGASLFCLIVERFFAYSAEWYVKDNVARLWALALVIIIFIISCVLLYLIK